MEYKKLYDEFMEKKHKEWEDYMVWGKPSPKRELREDDNVKLAWVIINTERKMVGVDTETLKGYELEDKYPIWKLPLVPIEYDSLERWCTGFDV